MKVAVFGAQGFIGGHLCKYLESTGNELTRYSSMAGNQFDETTGLLIPGLSLEKNLDCVIYLSQSPRHRQLPEEVQHLWNVNVVSAIEAARLAVHAGTGRFIYASTGNVFEPSFSPLSENDATRRDQWYPLSKLHAEEALMLFGNEMEVINMRLFVPYGSGQKNRLVPNLINRIRNRKPVTLEPAPGKSGNDGLVVSPCFVDDLVRIIASLAMKGGPDRLCVASDERKSIREIAGTIGEILSVDPVFRESSTPRQGNLIADISRLKELMDPDFTTFDIGIRTMLDSKIADKA